MITVEPITDIAFIDSVLHDPIVPAGISDDSVQDACAVPVEVLPDKLSGLIHRKRTKAKKSTRGKRQIATVPPHCLYATPGTAECHKLDVLEARMHLLPETEIPVVHLCTPGLYLRQVTCPAGTLIITKIHLTEHPFIVSKGTISVWTEAEGVKRLSAPYTGVSKAGTRRLCYCHTEVVWTTCHATDETDPDKIESQIILPHPIDVEALNADQCALLEGAFSPVALMITDALSNQPTN